MNLNKQAAAEAFLRLLDIMNDLREKCPWDKKQTLESLSILTIEELYELTDAIANQNLNELKEELGDVMLHLVFYAKIASEKNAFTITEAINEVCEKLIRRHPHIYGSLEVKTEDEVKKNWEKLKLSEGKKSILSGVPKSLPSIAKAYRLQEKVKQVGFEWETTEEVWEKVEEELIELKQSHNKNEMSQEFGDVLFSLINYARFNGIDPEAALQSTNKKFKRRFEFIESRAETLGKSINDMSLAEMDAIWEEAKQQ